MGNGWLVACGVAWVSAGLWWAMSPAAGRLLARVHGIVAAKKAVGPLALVASLLVAVAGAATLPRHPLSVAGKLSPLGWLTAMVGGGVFVSLQAFGARAVSLQFLRGAARETSVPSGASKPSEDGTP